MKTEPNPTTMTPKPTTPQNELAKIAIATIRDRGHLANFTDNHGLCATIPLHDSGSRGGHLWISPEQIVLVYGGSSFSMLLMRDRNPVEGLDDGGYKVLLSVTQNFLDRSQERIDKARKEKELDRAVRVLAALQKKPDEPSPEERIEGAYSDALAGESLDLRHKYCEATETFNGVTFKDFERYARTVAYKVAKNLANGHEMDWSRSPLNP